MPGLETLAHGIYGEYAYDEKQGWYCLLCDRNGRQVGETGCDADIGVIKTAAQALARAINRERRG